MHKLNDMMLSCLSFMAKHCAVYCITLRCVAKQFSKTFNFFQNVELLLKDDISLLKESIFHCQDCIKKSSYEMLKLILEKYISRRFTYFFQIQNERNRTPLHEAAFAGRTDILKLLLERGASVESRR